MNHFQPQMHQISFRGGALSGPAVELKEKEEGRKARDKEEHNRLLINHSNNNNNNVRLLQLQSERYNRINICHAGQH